MKKYLLTLVLVAFAISFSPFATAAETALVKEELPFFKKKKKGVSSRYKHIKRNKKSYAKRHKSNNKKKSFF
ncbi:hypothetical protein EFA69_04295 [Rufibacter immobilis]|uniref:Uncharacterized protein n=1 Tax=Rufibacter immobilis TaxID=1348778 RepID=A0A3M9N480_9BACT|nr:hypothetical protein [Rufibacter immobilis]RNI32546.1 hypothetical protein EFA69_04295 [Rufibacter immobilis]